MKKVIQKYLKEFEILEKQALNENGEFINEYNSEKISSIFDEKIKSLLSQIEEMDDISIVPKYEMILRKLYILYLLLDERGFCYAQEMSSEITDNNKWMIESKIRLFMMFVKRFYETIYLLKGGLSTAALDRARGIYEINVYSEIINRSDEKLAEKFLKHANVSRLDLARSFADEQAIKKIEEQIDSFDDDYLYKKNNGWAKDLFPGYTGNISFKKLADTTSLKVYYYMYKMACLSTHATIIDSVEGIDLSKDLKGKNIWTTVGSDSGQELVIRIIKVFSGSLIMSYLDKNLPDTFIKLFFKHIIENE